MKRVAARSFLVTLAVWIVFSWPLPRHLASAIPAGTTPRSATATIRPMEPGDHLQLLYHFWLFSDFFAGKTPWFHNQYEFNTGDDAARFEPGSYYFPFSLIFTVGNWIGGRAFGWNLAGLLSLWLTFLFTWKLARRYTDSDGWAALASLVAVTFPYRWINLTGGSPTGFSMMWVPALLLGLDIAVRDSNWRGGLLAGVAILFASWGDTHVFYFSGLMIPCWCIVALARRDDFKWNRAGRVAAALLPVPLLAGLAVWCSKEMTKGIASSHAEGGRTIKEVALFSPHSDGFFTWAERGITNHIYLGYAVTALLLAGLVVFAIRARQDKRATFVFLMLLVGVAGVMMLSLGPFSPFDGRPFTAARKFIPQYTMIRQPAKIFCLLPTLLAVAFAMITTVRNVRALTAVLLAATVIESGARFMPILCPLDDAQAAYKAVASAGDSNKPQALVLPLWPGDSHYTSVYEYYASLYRIRLVNGYRPFVPQDYVDNVFKRFESANQGSLTDDQLDALLKMGVQCIVLHEDLFPEKVSPFPVGFTLKNLLNHPRLTLLKHAETAWAFHIEASRVERPELAANWTYLFSTRQWPAQKLTWRDGKILSREFYSADAPGLHWMARVRGHGTVIFSAEDKSSLQGVNRPTWQWHNTSAFKAPGYSPVNIALTVPDGVQLDRLIFAAGDWPRWNVNDAAAIPAPCFFHAGYTDLENNQVVIRRGRERHDLVFYGPKLPVQPGTYRVAADFDSDASTGTSLGEWYVACPEGREIKRLEMKAGAPLETEFRVEENLPLVLAFQYHGGGNVAFKTVTLTRIE